MSQDPVDTRLQQMLDEHEIRQLLAEYVHGCDRVDAALLASVYWPDSWDDHGITQAPGPEFASIMAGRIANECEILWHLMGQSLIRIDGDEARAETYFLAVTRRNDEDGTPFCSQLGGRYADLFTRREGRWKIKHRTAIRDWSLTIKVEADHFALAQLQPGTQTPMDPGATLLGLAHKKPEDT